MKLSDQELKDFLNEKHDQYNNQSFIASDPIQIPHQVSKKEDIEIIAFLVATIAWGQRGTIINNGNQLLDLMDHAPHEFICDFEEDDLGRFDHFKHRTFNAVDAKQFMRSLKHIYQNHGGLETVFSKHSKMHSAIHYFKKVFFEVDHEKRTEKHVSDPHKGSAAKRINMYLRWMVRNDKRGVDFGIWNDVKSENLMMPLDVHTQNVGRKLGLLKRTQNDWKAVEELTSALRKFDKEDPVKFDFALFGLGVFEGFK